ncbi:hypothetical protein KEM54_001011 [Ascosphaera aggregata]|nr:hypothetical protein KEM54_001011 [Ascosphaera aggregata]
MVMKDVEPSEVKREIRNMVGYRAHERRTGLDDEHRAHLEARLIQNENRAGKAKFDLKTGPGRNHERLANWHPDERHWCAVLKELSQESYNQSVETNCPPNSGWESVRQAEMVNSFGHELQSVTTNATRTEIDNTAGNNFFEMIAPKSFGLQQKQKHRPVSEQIDDEESDYERKGSLPWLVDRVA